MDLSETLGLAVGAARRGDVDALESELARLRAIRAPSVGSIGTRLRAIARSVREHPSFSDAPRAQAV